MLANPITFTYEHLSSLKFKELQKLSAQFHVNKRWAKKQELIEKLLALKDDKSDDKASENNEKDEKEWTDGSTVFCSSVTNNSNENDADRRLTFNVDKKSDVLECRQTFEVSQNKNEPLRMNTDIIVSRETYDVAPTKADFGMEVDQRATFEIPPKETLLTEEIDPRATFDVPQNGKELLKESETEILESQASDKKILGKNNKEAQSLKSGLKQINLIGNSGVIQSLDKKLTFDVSLKQNVEKGEKGRSSVKMLTIPYERVSRRNRKDGEASKTDKTPIKMSQKSINIKKSTRQPPNKIDSLKSPASSSVRKTLNRQIIIQSTTKPQQKKIVENKLPTKLQFNEDKLTKFGKVLTRDENNKENTRRVLRRKKSKTEDNAIVKKQSIKVSFMSPPASLKNIQRASLPLKKTPFKDDKNTPVRLNQTVSRIPKAKSGTIPAKAATISKMPDFAKIHQRQFEQMDSLHDYVKKKEERARKLFGTPQPGPQSKVLNKSTTLFKFQSSISEKPELKFGKSVENLKNLTTPFKKKETNVQKEAVKSKLPPTKVQTDIKDKNRSHIHGVRTNKRFELQMKFRNMV